MTTFRVAKILLALVTLGAGASELWAQARLNEQNRGMPIGWAGGGR